MNVLVELQDIVNVVQENMQQLVQVLVQVVQVALILLLGLVLVLLVLQLMAPNVQVVTHPIVRDVQQDIHLIQVKNV